jgi:urease accessory protein
LGGGLVEGDAIELEVEVAPGATALLSSMGALRVYRSPRGSRSALSARVGEGGLFALLPDPVSCFAGARCEQRTSIALAPGASLVSAELLTSGRAARGERWAFARWSSTLEISCDGRAAVRDALLLDPAHGHLPERLGRVQALATLLLLGPQVAAPAAALRAQVDAAPLAPRSPLLESCSPVRDGVLLRMAGESAEAVAQAVRARLSFLPELLGDDPWARRA